MVVVSVKTPASPILLHTSHLSLPVVHGYNLDLLALRIFHGGNHHDRIPWIMRGAFQHRIECGAEDSMLEPLELHPGREIQAVIYGLIHLMSEKNLKKVTIFVR